MPGDGLAVKQVSSRKASIQRFEKDEDGRLDVGDAKEADRVKEPGRRRWEDGMVNGRRCGAVPINSGAVPVPVWEDPASVSGCSSHASRRWEVQRWAAVRVWGFGHRF